MRIPVDPRGLDTWPPSKETRELIEKYISQKETLILLVSEAKQDNELVTAIELARNHDPDGLRTLRILTKFDNFDSDEARSRAVELVNDGVDMPIEGASPTSSEGSAGSGASTATPGHVTKLGAHAVITMPGGRPDGYCGKAERATLAKAGVRGGAGVGALKQRLPDLYAELIRTNLPELRASIERAAEAARSELRRLGEEPADGRCMIQTCQAALLDALSELEEALSAPMLRVQERVRGTKKSLTRKWSDGKLRPNVFECPVFHGGTALRACMEDVVAGWRPLLADFEDEIAAVCAEFVGRTLATACDKDGRLGCFVPEHLRAIVGKQWEIAALAARWDLEDKCTKILNREVDFGTVNHYFTSKFAAERALPGELIDKACQSIAVEHLSTCVRYRNFTSVTVGEKTEFTPVHVWQLKDMSEVCRSLKQAFLDQRTLLEKEFESLTLHEQQQIRLFEAIGALWEVEHKTLLDMVLKELRATILDRYLQWVRTDLWTDDEIVKHAVESLEDGQRRDKAKAMLEKMRKCEEQLARLF